VVRTEREGHKTKKRTFLRVETDRFCDACVKKFANNESGEGLVFGLRRRIGTAGNMGKVIFLSCFQNNQIFGENGNYREKVIILFLRGRRREKQIWQRADQNTAAGYGFDQCDQIGRNFSIWVKMSKFIYIPM
jgi:hypothetical protein